jgi:hypothetical protein
MLFRDGTESIQTTLLEYPSLAGQMERRIQLIGQSGMRPECPLWQPSPAENALHGIALRSTATFPASSKIASESVKPLPGP